MNFTFPQSYFIWELLTKGHDCPVPVDKHGSVQKNLPHSLDPLGGVKYFSFAITKSVVIVFNETLHADRGTIDMKHNYETGF